MVNELSFVRETIDDLVPRTFTGKLTFFTVITVGSILLIRHTGKEEKT